MCPFFPYCSRDTTHHFKRRLLLYLIVNFLRQPVGRIYFQISFPSLQITRMAVPMAYKTCNTPSAAIGKAASSIATSIPSLPTTSILISPPKKEIASISLQFRKFSFLGLKPHILRKTALSTKVKQFMTSGFREPRKNDNPIRACAAQVFKNYPFKTYSIIWQMIRVLYSSIARLVKLLPWFCEDLCHRSIPKSLVGLIVWSLRVVILKGVLGYYFSFCPPIPNSLATMVTNLENEIT